MTTPIVILSGGFDPVHRGHIQLITQAAHYGEVHILLNSDEWLANKKGRYFMTWEARAEILRAMRDVADVHDVDDTTGGISDVLRGIDILRKRYLGRPVCFANGGDRHNGNTPEVRFCEENDIQLLFNVGGAKSESSSRLIKAASGN